MYTFTNPANYMVQHYDLEPILACLTDGGTILYPTDTVWGIGCDATNEAAVDKVYQIKNRDYSKPFVVLVSSIEMLKQYVEHIHPRVETLLLFHDKPLTIIYDKAINLAKNAVGQDGTIGIRIANDQFCKQLIENFGRPLVSTSANLDNVPIPNHFGEISSSVLMHVDHVVKYRQLDKDMDQPSVIARLDENEELEFLRS